MGVITDWKSDVHHWQKIDKFRYLGDVLDADRGCDSAVTPKV